MSYLLDALRKSELERRVGEIPILTPELPSRSGQQKRHPFIVLVIVLALINIGTLLYITVPDRVDPEAAKESPPRSEVPRSTSAPVEKTGHNAPSDISPTTKVPAEPRSHAKPMVSPKTQSPETLADISSAERKQTDYEMAKLAPSPNADPGTPENRAIQKVEKKVATPLPIKTEQDRKSVEQEQPVEKPLTLAKPPPPATPAEPATDGIPLLSAMSRDFQREVPSLNINVFVYSDVPEERFVIVNMNKYQSGEKVDNGPEILEIRSDSLVLEYLGQKFQVKRP